MSFVFCDDAVGADDRAARVAIESQLLARVSLAHAICTRQGLPVLLEFCNWQQHVVLALLHFLMVRATIVAQEQIAILAEVRCLATLIALLAFH